MTLAGRDYGHVETQDFHMDVIDDDTFVTSYLCHHLHGIYLFTYPILVAA